MLNCSGIAVGHAVILYEICNKKRGIREYDN